MNNTIIAVTRETYNQFKTAKILYQAKILKEISNDIFLQLLIKEHKERTK